MPESRSAEPRGPHLRSPVRLTALILAAGLLTAPSGCAPSGDGGGDGGGSASGGPGHRSQPLALSPEQELALGREAYREVLDHGRVLPSDDPAVERVRRVGARIVAATRIAPLMREINLNEGDYQFEWEFNVLESGRVNAFCLPAGKVAVFTGLLDFVRSDDEIATVMGHEIAHALAHHASERIAVDPESSDRLRASGGRLKSLDDSHRHTVIGLLGAGAALQSLSYNRFQESEADHIGVFLMTFAGYDPEASLDFWDRMQSASGRSFHLPEILSDHPADARRMAQLQAWIPLAKGAKAAYSRGDVTRRIDEAIDALSARASGPRERRAGGSSLRLSLASDFRFRQAAYSGWPGAVLDLKGSQR